MNKKYNEIIDAACHYAPVFTSQNIAVSSQPGNSMSISEDEKATLLLASARPTESYSSYPREGEIASGEFSTSMAPEPEIGVSEIDLDDLCIGDQLMIETGHSVYSFTVTDPVAPAGNLIGGILGNRQVEACMMPPHRETRGLRVFYRRLRLGAKVSFLMGWGTGFRTLTTSSVTRLVHRKKA